jgi:cellulose biosynthesis protein BcsQ
MNVGAGLAILVERVLIVDIDLVMGGLIASSFDVRKVCNRTAVQSLKERFGALLLEKMIRENIAPAEAVRD